MRISFTMKSALVLTVFLVLIPGFLAAQVIADFEADDGGFGIGWGNTVTSISQAADPTGASTGALEINFDASGSEKKGAIQKTKIDASGAKLITFFVYLPSGTPDSILVKVWAQDQDWTWFDFKFYSVDIPKDVFYPLHFDLQAAHIANSSFDVAEGELQKVGMEFGTWDLTGTDLTWTGTFYLDNVSLVGVEPDMIADFETGTNDFSIGWGSAFTNLYQTADPTGMSAGVLALDFDASQEKGAVQKTNIEVSDTDYMITALIYLPADIPDKIMVKTWAQDQSWTWHDFKFFTGDIPKETWVPLHFDLKAAHIKNPGFDVAEGPLQKIGIELGTWDLTGDDTTWTGTIYLDNVAALGTETGLKWVVADFENQVAGTRDFAKAWGDALTNVAWAQDPTGQSSGVLSTDWDFGSSSEQKGAFEKGNVNIFSTELDTFAYQISMDVYLPADIPLGAQVSIFGRDHVSWNWTEDAYFIDDSALVRGQWNTIYYDVLKHVNEGKVDPTGTISVGCQIYYSAAQTWSGSVYWDNFTYYGIPEPVGEVTSPTVIAAMDTVIGEGVAAPYFFTHLQWIDNAVGTETYNVYVSENPIDDVTAEGVVKIASKIPHGQQEWGHRPWSRDGAEKTFYYAITATSTEGIETDLIPECKAGPITLPTSITAKAQYVADFANSFVLDGLDNEFDAYKINAIKPETAGNTEGPNWTLESTDMNFNVTFVIDDNYLYISADVTDDDLRNPPGQAWEGDALEFYMGYYDIRNLIAYHPKNSVSTEGTGDWRIAFTAWGTIQLNGTTETTIPGVEATVFQKFSGDGYIIEARLELDSLVATGEDWVTEDGAMMPLRIDGTDMDPSFGDESRTLIVQFGGSGGVTEEDWKRPSTWGYLEVLGGPVAVADQGSELPLKFDLAENYPNPFNPVTTLRYQLATTSDVTIAVYNILGKKVRTIFEGNKAAGYYSVQWDGTDDFGVKVSSGVYFCKMTTPTFKKTVKMLMMK